MSENTSATDPAPEATPAVPATPTNTTPPSAGERMLEALKTTAPPPEATSQVEGETPPEQPPAPSFVDRLKEMGFQDVTDEEEAKQRVLDALRQTQLRAEEAARRAQELQRLRELEQQQQATQTQPTTPHTEQPKLWQFRRPSQEVLEAYQTVKTDETGKEVVSWVEGTPLEIRQQAESSDRARKQWAHRWVNEPEAVLEEIFDHYLPQYVARQLEQVTTQQQQSSFIEKFETDNPWLFASDPLTKQRTGFSAEGEQFTQFMREAAQLGIQDIQHQVAYATRLREAELAKRQVSQATVSQTNNDKKRDLLQRGAGNPPSQGGSLPSPTAQNQRPQNPLLSPGERFLAHSRQNGVALHP